MSCIRFTHESDKSKPWLLGALVCLTTEPTKDLLEIVNIAGNRRNMLQMTAGSFYLFYYETELSLHEFFFNSWRFGSTTRYCFVSWRSAQYRVQCWENRCKQTLTQRHIFYHSQPNWVLKLSVGFLQPEWRQGNEAFVLGGHFCGRFQDTFCLCRKWNRWLGHDPKLFPDRREDRSPGSETKRLVLGHQNISGWRQKNGILKGSLMFLVTISCFLIRPFFFT